MVDVRVGEHNGVDGADVERNLAVEFPRFLAAALVEPASRRIFEPFASTMCMSR